MIITLITAGIFVIAIVLYIIYKHTHGKFHEFLWKHDINDGLPMIATIAGTLLAFMLLIILINNINPKDRIENANGLRNDIVECIENGHEYIFDEAIDFNDKWRGSQIGLENPWVNWFYQSVAKDIELIDLSNYGGDQ